MNVIDVIIILFILLGGVAGFKAGVLKKIVSFVGLFIVVYLSFRLKNYLSPFIYENLPFFNFWGIFKGIQVLNIIFYEFLSFIIIASLLSLIYNVLLKVTGILENVLKATVILSIPSKLLGIIVGMIEEYIWVFIALVVFTLPVFHFNMISESKLANFILNNTPFLSGYATKSVEVYNDIYEVIDNRQGKTNYEVNKEALIILLDNKVAVLQIPQSLLEELKIIHLEKESDFDNLIQGNVLVDFYANWCGPCKMLGPILEEVSDLIQIVKVDVDNFEEISKKYRVMSIPTIVLFKNGEELKRNVGFIDKNTLEKFIG